ncbi:hypothetical protein [Reichenbachiella sp.]|uniref:hypothetical protein n=1 Tax=Reichenbachiella sp. TaxID=2184521 RepID=UPI00329A47E9
MANFTILSFRKEFDDSRMTVEILSADGRLLVTKEIPPLHYGMTLKQVLKLYDSQRLIQNSEIVTKTKG